MRSATFTLPVVLVVVVTGVLLFRPACGPSGCRKKQERERVSSIVHPAPPESLAMQQRWRVKSDLARRIITERIPLLEAAKLFGEVNGEDGLQNLTLAHPERSVHELLCRQAVGYVEAEERQMEREGYTFGDPRVSRELRREFDRRMAAGEFPPSSTRE